MTEGDKISISAVILTGIGLLVALSLWFGRLNTQVENTQINVAAMEARRAEDHDVLIRMEQDLRSIRDTIDLYAKEQQKAKPQ
jgi:hypothetical protein